MEEKVEFMNLPTETLTEVLISSDIDTLSSLCLTNNNLSAICNDDYIWKKKLEQEYSNISYKDIYLTLNSISKLFHNCIDENYPDERGTDNIQITRRGKYNLYHNFEGPYYEVLPDISIVSRKYVTSDISNEVLNGYGIKNDSPLGGPVQRLVIKRTFPNDMDWIKIINERRAEVMTFESVDKVSDYYHTHVVTNVDDGEVWMFLDITKGFSSLEAYTLKSLGLVNIFEHDQNGNLILLP